MHILYYDWGEFTREDCREALEALGAELTVVRYDWDNLADDPRFERVLTGHLGRRGADGSSYYACAYSFNFFPVVSRACMKCGVPYISYVFDAPHLTLKSYQIANPVNHVYIFDRALYLEMKAAGISTVHYAPLAVSGERLKRLSDALDGTAYEHDVCFLGSLYDNEYTFFNQIDFLPEELRGFFEGIFAAQRQVYGCDLIGNREVVPEEKIAQLHQYVNFALSGRYDMDEEEILRSILRKKVTQLERRAILEELGQYFKVDLYTSTDQPPLKGNVYDLGPANYRDQMPHIFNRSRINLNITLRSIFTGMPLRTLDIMAAGGFLISNYQEELAEYFVDGEDLVLVRTPEEFKERCAYYLTHEEEREQIAKNGQAKTLARFDYLIMLRRLLTESLGEGIFE